MVLAALCPMYPLSQGPSPNLLASVLSDHDRFSFAVLFSLEISVFNFSF